MVSSAAKTVDGYLRELPADRREVISRVRTVVRKHLPRGYEESMGFGMITWSVPLSRLAETYNKQPLMYAALAAQKNFNAIYLMGVYGDAERARRFTEGFANQAACFGRNNHAGIVSVGADEINFLFVSLAHIFNVCIQLTGKYFCCFVL